MEYRLDFNEGFRGESDTSGSVYSGRLPDIGWVWKLTEYHVTRNDEDDTPNVESKVVLASSQSVFHDIAEAMENARQVLRILEPDPGRYCPINSALKKLAAFGP